MDVAELLDDLDALDVLDDLDVVAPPPPSSRSLRAATQAAHEGKAPAAPPPLPPAVRGRDGSIRGSVPDGGFAALGGSKADIIADSLSTNPAVWIDQLWRASDDQRFAERAPLVEPAVRILAERGDTRALWSIACALYRAAGDGGHRQAAARAASANRILRAFGDPTMLSTVARHALAEGEEVSEEARRLLVQAGGAGAYGLYGARLRVIGQPAARVVFVRLMSSVGNNAWPVVKAALDKLHKTISDPRAREVAEDLLLTVPATAPKGGDDSAAHLVVRFLRVDSAGVNKAATMALLRLWGDRARSLLISLLEAKQDSVRLAALAGLRQLSALDEHVAPRVSGILLGRVPAGDDLRVGAALALGHVTSGARSAAITTLEQIVLARAVPASRPAGPSRENEVVLAAATSLVQLRAPDVRAVIAERAKRSRDPLRSMLEELLYRL